MNVQQLDTAVRLSQLQQQFPAAATFWSRYLDAVGGAAPAARPSSAAARAGQQVMLNLGCGSSPLPGFVNVDIVEGEGIDAADLSKPWPWPDDSVDYVYASHVIEHLPDKIHTMNELWRVLRNGAAALIHVPTTEGSGAWQDPTHVSFWNRRSFLYFEDGSPYREGFASSYGIRAKLRTQWEAMTPTPDGPQLSMLLQAVKS